jgi:hypothetical protein
VWQAEQSHPAGHSDVNHADRLSQDETHRLIGSKEI